MEPPKDSVLVKVTVEAFAYVSLTEFREPGQCVNETAVEDKAISKVERWLDEMDWPLAQYDINEIRIMDAVLTDDIPGVE